MRRPIGSLAVLAVTSVVAACSTTTPARPSSGANTSLPVAARTSPLATLGLASRSPELFTTIPTTGGPPQALASGTVASPSGFEPALTFQLPAGWYGHGNTKGLAIGTDLNLAAERFDGPSVSIDVVDMPMDEAVARFRAVQGLAVTEPSNGTIDGRAATTFQATASSADPVVLEDALGIGVDIGPGSVEQTFVDLGSTTLLIRTGTLDPNRTDELASVLSTLRFDG